MSVSYPKTGDANGSGEVATGLRIKHYKTGNDPGVRITLGGSVAPSYYEVFYDVYLKEYSPSTGFRYEFRYYYRQVIRSSAPPAVAPNPWIPTGTAKLASTSGDYVTSILGQAMPGQGLPLRGSTWPLGANSSAPWLQPAPPVNPSPSDFGWTGSGAGSGPGNPFISKEGGARPFITSNPFGYKKDGDNEEESSGGSGEPGASSGETTSGATTDDDPYSNSGPPIPGFTTSDKRRLYLNPPPIQTLTGAYVPVVYDWEGNRVRVDETESPTRQSLLGYGSYASRLARKARILQWIEIEDEWRATAGSATGPDGEVVDTWDDSTPLVPTNTRYGFRFTYNPSEIQFNMSPVPGLDPGVIISGLGKSYPMGDEDGGSIQLTTYLNRIEDMAFITSTKGGYRMTTGINPYGTKKLTEAQQKGIYTRGTGFDLEYLFRTTLGRAFPTRTRGITADIGLILGLPLLLNLGGRMSYTGRLTGLSYTHMYFTHDMVPTFTQVSMSFTRFPDAIRFNVTPNPGDGGENKNNGKKDKRPGSGNKGGRGSGGRTT